MLLTVLEKLLPVRYRGWTLSATCIGLGFILPPNVSLTIFAGGLIALVLGLVAKKWSTRLLATLCAGLIVGESLTDAGTRLFGLLLG